MYISLPRSFFNQVSAVWCVQSLERLFAGRRGQHLCMCKLDGQDGGSQVNSNAERAVQSVLMVSRSVAGQQSNAVLSGEGLIPRTLGEGVMPQNPRNPIDGGMHRVAPAAGYLGLLSKLKLGLKIRNGNSSDMYFEFSDAVHFALKHSV